VDGGCGDGGRVVGMGLRRGPYLVPVQLSTMQCDNSIVLVYSAGWPHTQTVMCTRLASQGANPQDETEVSKARRGL